MADSCRCEQRSFPLQAGRFGASWYSCQWDSCAFPCSLAGVKCWRSKRSVPAINRFSRIWAIHVGAAALILGAFSSDGFLRFALASAALCALCFGLRAELLARVDVETYLGADVPRDLPEDEKLRLPRAVWFLTVGGVVLGMWSFYLLVLHAYAG
jgi:hypothetical protein